MNNAIKWLVVGLLGFWVLKIISGLLPPIFLAIGSIVAIICLYSLLPYSWRLPAVERWLDPDWGRQPLSPTPATPTPTFSPDLPTASPTIPALLPVPQPALDYSNLSIKRDLPTREQLTEALKARVIGQDEAIDILVRVVVGKLNSLPAAKGKTNKPLVVMLPGTTGTGKTELAKALAEALGVEFTRFDMGEYMDAFKASNLMGSAKGYVGGEDGGALPNAIRKSKKRLVVLFDEVEKAHTSIWQQLLAFFDEGRCTDTRGLATCPKDTICILTSNQSAEQISANPEQAKEILKASKMFSPELLGRIDKIIPMLRLNLEDTARLTVITARRIARDYDLNLTIDQDVLEHLVDAIHEEAERYGGRGIAEKVKDLLLDDLIDFQSIGKREAKLGFENGRLLLLSKTTL